MGAIEAGSKLVQHLTETGQLPFGEVTRARAQAEGAGVPTPVQLVESGRMERRATLAAIAERVGLEFYDPAVGPAPTPEALMRMPAHAAVAETALALRIHEGHLVVATDDPFDLGRHQRLEALTRSAVTLVLGERTPLQQAVEQAYRNGPVTMAPVAVSAPGSAKGKVEYHINDLLERLLESGGSDLHLTAGAPPQIRLNGDLAPVEGFDRLQAAPLRELIYGILSSRQREQFEEKLELDMSHPLPGRGRFRVNVFFQRGAVGAVLRAIPNRTPGLDELGMPQVVRELTEVPRGLVLVTGTTGSGKSTTLAAMIDEINSRRRMHIVTIEDPIEFIHQHKLSVVNQREVGADTQSFAMALRHALRQDPDVILVGEMRDLETIAIALTAAETGHLVLATLHTQDAPGSVERIVDVFPPHQQQQVRVQLASALQGVIAQQLLPTVDGRSRVPAVEVMIATPAVRNLIREGKVHQIRNAMQAGGRHGMQTMDHALTQLVRSGTVDLATASLRATNVEEFMTFLGGTAR
jgi:twitching motility protein PilT